jgi:hypothetical protein
MATRRLAAVDATAENGFEERSLKVRGTDYTIRELSSGEYDKIYKQAESQDGEIDTAMLLRLMAHKAVVVPEKFSADDLAAMPMRAARTLLAAVNQLHFGDEAQEEESPKND